MANIAETSPTIFCFEAFSRNAMNPMRAEVSTTETFVIASTVESFQPVV